MLINNYRTEDAVDRTDADDDGRGTFEVVFVGTAVDTRPRVGIPLVGAVPPR
jgi:hypothetical protein